MSIDLRKMSKADLDKLNIEIARYKVARNPGAKPESPVDLKSTPPEKRDTKSEQLDLFGVGD